MDNNLPSRIDDYLDQVFGPYEDSPAVAELRIEVRHDLLERLSDLIEHGIGDEVAYAQVISSVGDIGSTIRELAEQERAQEGSDPRPSESATSDAGAEADRPASHDEQPAPEPEGPSWAIPEGATPGSEWSDSESSEEKSGDSQEDSPGGFSASWPPNGRNDWVNDVTQIVTTNLDAIRTQVASALEEVESALDSAGGWENVARQVQDKGKWSQWKGSGIFFAASDLRDADFHDQQMPKGRFAASRLRNANFSGAMLAGSKFASSDLRGANFSRADLSRANLSTCSLRGANFERAILTGTSLTCADMRNIAFVGTIFTDTKATYADLRGARFSDCRMEGTNFTGADLRGANLDGLVLTNVNFSMANLSEASFRGSTLRNVNFRYVSKKATATMVFEDTVMDQVTYMSLRSTGSSPEGIRVEG